MLEIHGGVIAGSWGWARRDNMRRVGLIGRRWLFGKT